MVFDNQVIFLKNFQRYKPALLLIFADMHVTTREPQGVWQRQDIH
jgi:hypothetical protein